MARFGVDIPGIVKYSKVEYNSQIDLLEKYPPVLMSSNKKLLRDLWSAKPSSSVPDRDCSISFSRWTEWPLPKDYNIALAKEKTNIVKIPGAYEYKRYEASSESGRPIAEWYVNFADRALFGFYGGPLFAQDEMQVAEHPILASIKEAVSKNYGPNKSGNDEFLLPYTRSEQNAPTPCLIKNAERRLSVAVNPDPAQDRPNGLYGNWFSRGSEDAIRKATTVFDPLTCFTNIIAIEAPKGGRGTYTYGTIKEVTSTIYTAAMAAKAESSADGKAHVVIHSGHWGTGAFGGNRVLMAALQIVGVRLAGIDTFVFHGFDDLSSVEEAIKLIDKLTKSKKKIEVAKLFNVLVEEQFKWGQSDGN